MTEKELDEQWTQQMQNQLVQCGLAAPGRQAGAIIPRLSDDDVARIADALALRLCAEADWLQRAAS